MPNVDRCSASSDRALSDACFTISSVASLIKKEGQDKLKLAEFARQLDEKRFLLYEINRQKVERAKRKVE